MDKLGCNVDNYVENIKLWNCSEYEEYLLVYQCTIQDKIKLKMALMTVYSMTNDSKAD